ncbi:MAG: HAD hydrolase family protein [Acidimicrobiales bacterium]
MIASDLDGTLFGADHVPERRTVAAVNAARDAGIHLVAVTGRSWFTGAPLATSTGARLHHFLGSNGGHRLDLATGELEERLCFGRPSSLFVDTVHDALGPLGLGYETADGMIWDERFVDLLSP